MEVAEIKAQVDAANKLLADLRESEKKRVADIETRFGTQDALLKEQQAQVNQAIDDIITKVKKAEEDAEAARVASNRPGMGGADGTKFEVKAEDMAAFKAMCKNVENAGVKEYVEHQAAVQAYLRKGADGPISDLQVKAMSVDSDPDGGYFVMPDTTGRVIEFVYESSPMRQFANVQTIGTDALEGSYDLDEAESGWVGERQTREGTDTPKVGRWRIPVHEMYAEPSATQKLLDDASVNIEEWLARKVRRKFSRQEATAFVTGDGVDKPRGFLTYPAGIPDPSSTALYKRIEQRVTGADGAYLSADNLINLVHDLKAEYRNGAAFAMNRTTQAATRTLKDGDGQYVLQMDFRGGLSQTILGYPIAEFNDMPDPATNSLSVGFGNFGEGYQIVDRLGIRVLRDPFTSKPFVKFYTTRRVGGDVVNFEAIKLLKFATS